jgi:hypothetical protein
MGPSSKLDERWFARDGGRLVLAIPREELVRQGLRQLLVLPIGLGGARLYAEVAEDPVLAWIVGGVLAALGIPLAILGVLGIARAGSRATRSRVVIDGGRIVHDTGTFPASAVTALVVRPQSRWLKFLALDAELRTPPADAPDPFTAPAEGRVRLLAQVPPTAGPELAGIGREIARALGVDLRVEGGVDRQTALGIPPGTLAMLCYLPFQGIFLVASIGVLVARPADPLVRFHARQSLALFAAELGAFAVAFAVLGVALAALGDEAGLVVGLVAVGVVAIGRLGLRIVACLRASKLEPWLVPGLGRWTARWLPR